MEPRVSWIKLDNNTLQRREGWISLVVLENWPRLLLIDNIEMHVYYDRHVEMVECMKQYFSQHQVIATTHSGVLITRSLENKNDSENEQFFNLEEVHSKMG